MPLIEKRVATLTSNGSGDATATVNLNGIIERVVTNPDGDSAPTDNWDLTLVDADGVDVAGGLLANRDTANSEQVIFPTWANASGTGTAIGNGPAIAGDITVTGANMGSAKVAVVTIYYLAG